MVKILASEYLLTIFTLSSSAEECLYISKEKYKLSNPNVRGWETKKTRTRELSLCNHMDYTDYKIDK